MELERLMRRQAIGEWRDGHILGAMEMFNTAGKASADAVESALPRAGAADLWDPDAFAAREIDPLMRRELEGALAGLIAEAADDLKALNPAYAALGDALAEEGGHIAWPAPLPAPAPAQEPLAAITPAPASRLTKVTDTLGWMARSAADTIGEFSNHAGQTFKDRTGLHDRLREAARRRIATAWMGESGEKRPVLSHIILMLDETANQARSMA